jgi:plasmid maintenance system antidote protein VapI
MKKVQIFSYISYKKYLLNQLFEQEGRGALSRLAETIGCQRSYLSRVINKDLHLTMDQAYLAAQFFQLNKNETEYFMCLVELDRCANKKYREFLQQKLLGLRQRLESLSDRTSRVVYQPTQNEDAARMTKYFSHWAWSAIHFLSSSRNYQTVEKIAHKLNLNEDFVKDIALGLKQNEMVEYDGKIIRYKGGDFHIPKESVFNYLHHQNWRGRALQDAIQPGSDGLHYSCVQTIEKSDYLKLKAMMIDFIENSKNVMNPSAPEEGVVICLDLFQL